MKYFNHDLKHKQHDGNKDEFYIKTDRVKKNYD